MDDVTLSIRWMRAKRYIDEMIEMYEGLEPVNEWHHGYLEGYAMALTNLKLAYFLTAEESAEIEATRREMFG